MLIVALPLIPISHAQSQPEYTLQVGANGDEASRGNVGVQVEIRGARAYSVGVGPVYANFFWVGDDLNGAFIQFGYLLSRFEPWGYCLYGERVGGDTFCLGSYDPWVSSNDPRWFWQYWPNAKVDDFYFATGPKGSAEYGFWHLYTIQPNAANGWNFVLDGRIVSSFNLYHWVPSRDPAYVVAEEGTISSTASGDLGPAEFRNLSYLKGDGWHKVTSLTAISSCVMLNANCDINIPYGVSVLGPNDILIGTYMQLRRDGEPLKSPS
jgi:hypothetical protein